MDIAALKIIASKPGRCCKSKPTPRPCRIMLTSVESDDAELAFAC
jgi:hypothetical protein